MLKKLIIKSMAKDKKIAIEKLQGIRKTLIPHIAKCLADGKDGINFKHHLKEVIAQYNAILKIRKKEWDFVNDRVIYENLYSHLDEDVLQVAQELNSAIPDSRQVDVAFRKFEEKLMNYTRVRVKMTNEKWISLFSIVWDAY